jgi:hypothetical protein
MQRSLLAQPGAHVPAPAPAGQLFEPHSRPSHCGWQSHLKVVVLQAQVEEDPCITQLLPHMPPQPSGPHCLLSQFGTHSHWPLSSLHST